MASSGISAASAVLKSTPEKRNLLLTGLLIAGGTPLVQDVFDSIHPPHTPPAILRSPLALSKLKRPHVTKPQLDLLYPAPGVYGKSGDFDITLLFKLLREICSLTPPVSTGSWDKLPSVTDLSLEADLARLKFYRNDIYGHTSNMEVTEAGFSVLWPIIRETMLRLAKFISPAKETEWRNAIDKFRGDPLTPEDEEHVEELKRWYLRDLEIKEEVDKLQKSMNEIKTAIANKVDDIEMKADDIDNKTDDILREVSSTNKKATGIKADLQQILTEVKSAKQSSYKTHDNQDPARRGALNQSQAMDIDSCGEIVHFGAENIVHTSWLHRFTRILEGFHHLTAKESQHRLEHVGENGGERLPEFFVEGKGVTKPKQMKALLLHCGGMDLQDICFTLPAAPEPGEG